ncbi:hypothetical protein [Calothrix sp. UHCC 0171]|uniref:hypothetical protein n=1 Tax=Calothrix sp. UHCC 0171 TaxID=3110245 RepID=UPI002B217B19|nr:hypothetical protein [Calothrix sp. UHCC 0171]MEA5572781.1 hypothetical protein [Calothrix sp. UHCC 0171]
MKALPFAVLGIVTALISLVNPVQAQSSRTSNTTEDATSLSGDSLTGIDIRTSEDDFSKFFGVSNSENTAPNNGATLVQYNETITLPDSPVYLQPAQQSVNGNEGVQVQLDLRNVDRPSEKPANK